MPSDPIRENRSFFAAGEQQLIRWFVVRIPIYVTPLFLTGIGVSGSVLASIALIGCNWSNAWLAALTIGVSLNWFGDSLDGSLARYRGIERPRFGFLVDHTCDLFSQLIIIISFGLSPYLSVFSALIILICYFLFSSYTYIRAATQRIHQMAYIVLGATEFRMLMIAYPLIAARFGVHEHRFGSLSTIDLAIVVLAIVAVSSLGLKAFFDARKLAILEPSRRSTSPVDEKDEFELIKKSDL
jgi:phosphatidylglycerophosphate synthase